MHELSLIQNLLHMVNESARENGITRVHRVKLVTGDSHGALPEALDFAFRVLARDTACDGAVLDMERKPVIIKCRDCTGEYTPEGISYRCPYCNSVHTLQVSGRELYVEYFEGD